MFESVLDTKRLPEAVQKLSDKLNAKVIGQERAIKGGKISLTNSEILCKICHLDIMHGNRRPQFRGGR